MAATPVVSFDTSTLSAFLGTQQTVVLSFDNAAVGAQTGYAPYIDLILPINGIDGGGTGNNPVNDGLTFVSATYLGAPVTRTAVEFNSSGQAEHPFARDTLGNKVIVTGNPGDTLLVLTLPFGSFTTEQTPTDILLTFNISNLADLNQLLAIKATGGFAYGADPFNNPLAGQDPIITGPTATLNIDPTVAELDVIYNGPEQETATGPSYPREWLTKGIFADGQSFTNVVLKNILPDGVTIIGTPRLVDAVTGNPLPGSVAIVQNPDGTQTVTGTFTGTITGGTQEPALDIDWYVPEFFNSWGPRAGQPVLNPSTGEFYLLRDNASLTADWDPIDGRDTNPTKITINPSGDEDVVEAQSIAIQKSVALLNGDADTNGVPDWQPGGTLEYTLDGQVSNFFEMKDLIVKDTLGDGQTFDGSFIPTVEIYEGGALIYSGPVVYSVGVAGAGALAKTAAGLTPLNFDISQTLQNAGLDRVLDGNGGGVGDVPHATNYTPPLILVKFHTTIDTNYTGPVPADTMVDQGDPVGNSVLYGGEVFLTDSYIEDDSAAGVTLPVSQVDKSIYAINGDTARGTVDFNTVPQIQAGDLITFRLKLDMPLTSAHQVKLSDYLPLPVLTAANPNADGTSGGAAEYSFSPVFDASSPGVGVIKFGPDDNFHLNVPGKTPTIAVSADGNSFTLNFGDVVNAAYPRTTLDLLVTLRVNDQPFGDGLLLTNQVTSFETNSFNEVSKTNDIIQFELGEPALKITKGVIAVDNPGGIFSAPIGPVAFTAPGSGGVRFSTPITSTNLATTPVDANLSRADAGDTVSFAIIVENRGQGWKGAFDALIRDTLPAGFVVPPGGINLKVTDGTGATLAFTGTANDLFGAGIEITDPSATQGGIGTYDPTSGKNIVVITYDLKLDANVQSMNTIVNTATTADYAAEEGGINRTTTDNFPDSDTASVSIIPTVSKVFVTSSNPDTGMAEGNGGLPDLAIGETVTWHITATIPEGVSKSLRLIDILPGGNLSYSGGPFELVSVSQATVGSSISGAGVNAGKTGMIFDTNGDGFNDTVVFDFGDVTNTVDNVTNANDQISFDITARVLTETSNGSRNQAGDTEINRATVQAAAPNGTLTNVDTSSSVEIVEPHLNIVKTVSNLTNPALNSGGNTSGDAGDTFQYTVTLTNTADSYGAPAYEVSIDDLLATLPSNMRFLANSVVLGTAPGGTSIVTGNGASDTSIKVTAPRLAEGESITFTFRAVAVDTAISGQSVVNTVEGTGTSMPGTVPHERTDYKDDDQATVTFLKVGGDKSIVTTSYTDTGLLNASGNSLNPGNRLTGPEDVKVDEVVTFKIVVTLPEGQIVNLRVTDLLPDVTATGTNSGQLVYVPGSASITYGANLFTDAGFTSNLSAPVSFVQSSVSGSDPTTNEQLVWNFGTVFNKPNNGSNDDDQIVITLQAKVSDIAANQRADILTNTATITADNGTNDVNFSSVEVVEPRLDLAKSVAFDGNKPNGDAGDFATYTLVVTHNGGNNATRSSATAYDLDITDTLPGAVNYVPGSLVLPPGVTGSIDGAGNITLHADALKLGESLTVTYRVQLKDNVVSTQQINNTANLDYQTIPPGTTDAPGREFTDTGTARLDVVIVDDVAKQLTGTDNPYTSGSNVGVGETVKYLLTATLGEGSQNLIIKDILESGLTYVSSRVVSIDSDITGSTLAVNQAGAVNGQTVTFNFGTVQNAGNNNVGPDTVVVEVIAQVAPGNLRGNVLTNTASLEPRVGTNPYGVDPNTPMPVITRTVDTTVVSAKVGNQIFEDRDANGVYNSLIDTGLAGVTVTLFDSNGVVVATTTTTSNGTYLFDNLVPGVYSESFSMPVTPGVPGAWYRSPTGLGGVTVDNDSDPQPNGTGQTITLVDNAVDLTHDAGYYRLVSLGDTAFIDVNGNGVADDGPSNVLANVKVELLNAGGTVVSTKFTDGQGLYSFTDLVPGTYSVRFTAPNGSSYVLTPNDQGGNDTTDSDAVVAGLNNTTGTTAPRTLFSGDNDPTIDAGFYIPAKLGNQAFIDANGNGTFDLGENGLDGVTVQLFAAGNPNPIATATTANGGLYLFEGLRPGTYTEKFTAPNGSTFVLTRQGFGATTNNDSDPNGTGTPSGTGPAIVLVSGDDDRTHDAGFYQPLSIGDKVFYDVNGDGIQGGPGEVGIQNVTVTLVDANGNQVAGVNPTLTDANGNYTFTGLPPGVYGVKFTTPAGFQITAANQTNDANDSDINAQGLTPTRLYTSGEVETTLDAGFWKPVAIGDTVFLDNNGNGLLDGGEGGVAGITVNLLDALGQAIAGKTTQTDLNGKYLFDNLPPGTYGVQFVMSNGYVLTRQDVAGGNDALDSDANTLTGKTGFYTLPAGTTNDTVDAGVYLPVTIGNYAFDDKNGNGVQDPEDTGVGGVTVKLINDNFPTETYTTVTAPDGSYLFTNLPPGSYHEEFLVAPGYVFTPSGQGTPATDSDPNPATGVAPGFSIASGQTDLTRDVGLYIPIKIGDRVFEDQNGNGVQDGGDTNLSGVTVNLLDGNNIVRGTMQTDANGNYLFTGLPPGQWHIQVVKPAGFEFTAANTPNDALDSDTDQTTGISPIKTYISGDDDRTVDSGLYRPVKIGDYAFTDRNGDGIQNGGDTALAGVTVTLINTITGQQVAQATTGPDGAYLFIVPPGTYKEIWTAPAGYVPTITGQGTAATDSNPNPLTGETTPITLTSGQSDLTQDGGFYIPVKIGDRVFEDQNGNGIQDAEDTNLGGVKVELLNGAGTVVATTTTAPDGSYLFDGLRPQEYQVRFTTPPGFLITDRDVGLLDTIDSDPAPATGLAPSRTYFSGDVDLTIDAGMYRPVTIGDRAWVDIKKDGIQQFLEPGLAGVTVNLIDDRTGATVGTTTTDGNGYYLFTGYKPSEYHVEFTGPNGYVVTLPLQGNDRALDSNPNAAGVAPQIRLLSGQTDLTIDAGFAGTGKVSGSVFLDLPPGICGYKLPDAVFEGIKVELITTTGLIAAIAFTDAQGQYLFQGLSPADYVLRFTNPDGTVFTAPKVAGTQGPRDSDVNPATGLTDVFTLALGQEITQINAGLDYTGVGLTGLQPITLPDGGGSYNFDYPGAYAIGGQGSYSMQGNGGSVYFIDGTGNNNLQGSGSSGAILVGGGGSNIMEGTGGRDIIIGGCGPNNFQGLGSNNFQGLGGGNNAWNYDLLIGGISNDIITSNSGNAIITGGKGDDALDGQGVFVGGPNNGTISYNGTSITGYSLGDHIKLSGLSTVNYQVGDGVQWIENFNPGRGDTIEVWGYAGPTATGLVNGQYALYFGPNSAIILNGYQPQNGVPLTGINYHPGQSQMPGAFGRLDALPPVILAPGTTSFHGTQGDDIAIATDAFTVLDGHGGDDILFGGEGGNLFIGGTGNDSMIGGKGNDIFRAGQGSDQIIGGEGNNIVQFDVTSAQATIVNKGNGNYVVTTPDGEQQLSGIQWVSFSDQYVRLNDVPLAPGAIILGTTGNDTYNITSVNDLVFERTNGGNDTALVSVNGWTLSPEIEIGRLTGSATTLSGNTTANTLFANAALASSLDGGAGDDTLNGGAANGSTLNGGAGDDTIISGTGAETLVGGAGSDTLVGDALDFASYANAALGVTARLDLAFLNTGEALGDTYTGIGGLIGSAQSDFLVGDGAANTLLGGGGADYLAGLGGADLLLGEAGNDTLDGGLGGDTLLGGIGADSLIGGDGLDFASYAGAAAGITARLDFPTLNTGEAAGDSYSGIEGLIGTGFFDFLVGDGAGNTLMGGGSADYLAGVGGADTLFGEQGDDTLDGGTGDDTLLGGTGADSLIGGGGLDFASYATAAAGVTVRLDFPWLNTGDAAGDSYSGISGLIGSSFNDTLVGDGAGQTLQGGGGADTLIGRGGADVLFGGAGADIFAFAAADFQAGVWDVIKDMNVGGTNDWFATTGIAQANIVTLDWNGGVIVTLDTLGFGLGGGGVFIENFSAAQLNNQLFIG